MIVTVNFTYAALLQERFWSKVVKTPTCWNWVGNAPRGRHGHFRIRKKIYKAHRISWEIFFGEIPKKLLVCHSCDNPRCVNPQHLFLGTNQDNMSDMVKKGRSAKGSKHPRSSLTEKQVSSIRSLSAEGVRGFQLAKVFNVSPQVISKIILNKRWK